VKLEGEKESLSSKNVSSKCLQLNEMTPRAKGRRDPFIAPKRNLPIGMSETWTCRGWRSDMSDNSFYNPALAPDISGAGA
jgi:hypothetical protein